MSCSRRCLEAALVGGFEEEDGGGGGDVEGFDGRVDGDADGVMAGGEEIGSDAAAFVAEEEEGGDGPVEIAEGEGGGSGGGEGLQVMEVGGSEEVCGGDVG